MPTEISISVLTVEDLEPAVTKHFRGVPHPFTSTEVFPEEPGVYVWSAARRVLYIGKADSLASRLGYERGEVAAHNPLTHWHCSVIHLLKLHEATVEWVTTANKTDSLLLERRLIEWHRACVGIAPLAVGWEAKDHGKPHGRYAAEQWAQKLWNDKLGKRPLAQTTDN